MDSGDETLSFRYRSAGTAGAIRMVLAAFAITAGLAYLAYAPPATHQTVFFARVLSPNAPRIFYGTFAVLCLGASLYALGVAIHSVRTRDGVALQHVKLGPAAAIVPEASMTMKAISMPYTTIREVKVLQRHGHKMAVISSPGAESRLLEKYFDSPLAFDAFVRALKQRSGA